MPFHQTADVRLAALIRTGILVVLLCLGLQAEPGLAATDVQKYTAKHPVADLVPTADSYDTPLPGLAIIPAKKSGEVVGYVYLNTDFSPAIGYSGKPIQILIGLDLKGKVTGAKLVNHSEPIILAGIPEDKIVRFIDGYKDFNIIEILSADDRVAPPSAIVSGATVTVLVIDDSIRVSAILAAKALGLIREDSPKVLRTLNTDSRATFDWLQLIADGSVRRLRLSIGDVNAAFEKTGNAKAISRPEPGGESDLFIDFFAASLAIPAIAKSLLGKAEYANPQKSLKPGENAFLMMGKGIFSFKGSGYVRGGIFDRIQLIQHQASIRFRDRLHKRLGSIAAEGAPDFNEIGLFKIPDTAVFDPAQPWRVQLLIPRAVGALDKVFISHELKYQLPDQYIHTTPATPTAQPASLAKPTDQPQLWQRIWQQKLPQIIILCLAISILTIGFFFQDALVKSASLTRWARNSFLLFTLVWIGWYAQAQLSVVNVFVFTNALLQDFRWEYFLLEPLIFILWCSVAASLIFWGRGAFCGWLCPFGALQELLNQIAKKCALPQYRLPWGVHERLWPIKYLIFLALLGVSVYSIAFAEYLAEVEPFKTAIVLKFMREWPFVLFVVVLLVAGLFVERFYCRYLCPLGAALAIPGKLAMFQWLKRYKNCGDPCHLCAGNCMVQAITPLGDINPNECLYCLNCQVKYHDTHECPVKVVQTARASKAAPGGDPIDTERLKKAKSLLHKPRRLGQERAIDVE